MNRSLSVFLSLMMVALVFLPGPAAAQKVDLKFAPQLNEVLQMQCIIDSKIQNQLPAMGQGQPQSQNITMNALVEIDCVVSEITPEKVSTLDVTIKRLAIDLSTPQQPIKFDTKTLGTPTEITGKILKALIGQKVSITVDQTGKPLSLSGVDTILDAVISSSDMAKEPKAAMIIPMIRSQVSDELISKQIEDVESFYPDHPVGVGDFWEVSQIIGGMQGSTVEGKYTVKSITPDAVITEFTGDLNQDMTQQMPNGSSMVQKQTGTMQGNVRFERETGMFSDMKMTQDVDATMQMTGQNNTPMTITTKTVQTITMKVR